MNWKNIFYWLFLEDLAISLFQILINYTKMFCFFIMLKLFSFGQAGMLKGQVNRWPCLQASERTCFPNDISILLKIYELWEEIYTEYT